MSHPQQGKRDLSYQLGRMPTGKIKPLSLKLVETQSVTECSLEQVSVLFVVLEIK